MKQEFENDVHKYIDLDTTDDEWQVRHNLNLPNLHPPVSQDEEIISVPTNRNIDSNFKEKKESLA